MTINLGNLLSFSMKKYHNFWLIDKSRDREQLNKTRVMTFFQMNIGETRLQNVVGPRMYACVIHKEYVCVFVCNRNDSYCSGHAVFFCTFNCNIIAMRVCVCYVNISENTIKFSKEPPPTNQSMNFLCELLAETIFIQLRRQSRIEIIFSASLWQREWTITKFEDDKLFKISLIGKVKT